MQSPTPGQRPINTGHSVNTQWYAYVRYRWPQTAPPGSVVCPPAHKDWKQLCSYLGHPSLKEREADFIYGGADDTKRDMEGVITDHLSRHLRDGVIDWYDVEWTINDEYEGVDEVVPVGGLD